MSIFNTILGRKQRSPDVQKASKICHQLCRDDPIRATDIKALIALGDEGIEAFRMMLTRNDDPLGITQREQIIDLLGSIDISNHQHASNTNSNAIIALLSSFLDEPDGMLGAKAISALVAYGSTVDDLLLSALKSNNRRTRSYAARALGQSNNKHAVAALIDALHDDDARVRSDVAEALGKLGAAQACAALINTLCDSNWQVRDSASVALTNLNDANMIDKMALLMHHDQYRMRSQAVQTLSRIDHKQTLPLLVSALDDSHAEVQWQAVSALSIYREAIVPLLAHYHPADTALRQRIAASCEAIGIHRVAMQLSHKTNTIRIAAAELLVQFGTIMRDSIKHDSTEPDRADLLSLLSDAWHHENNPDVQRVMITSIAQLVCKRGKNSPDIAITALIQATKHPNKVISYHARSALESLPHPLAKAFMQPALQDSTVAIACPSCLKVLQLKSPLTAKPYSCPQCHLGFTIHTGAGDVLLVTPATASVHGSTLPSQSALWFEVLQLQPDADVAAIKGAFRTLLKQYHPDKVAMLGTEFKQLAEQKTRLLTGALRRGLKQRGE